MNEKLIAMFVKALGLDPEKIQSQIAQLQNWIVTSIKNLDQRFRAVELDRADMHEKLDRILFLLEINDGQHASNGHAICIDGAIRDANAASAGIARSEFDGGQGGEHGATGRDDG